MNSVTYSSSNNIFYYINKMPASVNNSNSTFVTSDTASHDNPGEV